MCTTIPGRDEDRNRATHELMLSNIVTITPATNMSLTPQTLTADLELSASLCFYAFAAH
jgi:hypothetical protein